MTTSDPRLPLLRHVRDLGAARWIRDSLTTFGASVASYVPARMEAFARIYHPFDNAGALETWHDVLARTGRTLRDPADAADFALFGSRKGQARLGNLNPALIDVLIEHLGAATSTPDECYFAVWEGFGGSIVPAELRPKLELPHREYHVFTGPLEAARTSYSSVSFHHQSANLWWPADRRWCVATEIDFAWTYVGAPRACVDALLGDPRIEAVETSADARW